MYIANVQAKNEWQEVSALVSTAIGDTFAFSSDNTYLITNNSDYSVFLVNKTDAPQDKEGIGMRLPAHCQAEFKPGDSVKLWAITFSELVNLCVETVG